MYRMVALKLFLIQPTIIGFEMLFKFYISVHIHILPMLPDRQNDILRTLMGWKKDT